MANLIKNSMYNVTSPLTGLPLSPSLPTPRNNREMKPGGTLQWYLTVWVKGRLSHLSVLSQNLEMIKFSDEGMSKAKMAQN